MGPTGCTDKPVRNYHCSLSNNPEERSSLRHNSQFLSGNLSRNNQFLSGNLSRNSQFLSGNLSRNSQFL
jgi:hypothetical protein